MTNHERSNINLEKKCQRRTRYVKVTLAEEEFRHLAEKNPFSSLARLLRESALNAVNNQILKTNRYSKIDRDFLLELSRIGNNMNQIAKAINIDRARQEPFDTVKLLHLLIGIDESLQSLKGNGFDDH